jgi:uncharacterized protein YbjT (DUF2867 family)
VVHRLLEQGRKVFVLTRDVEKAYHLFGADVERVTGDVRQPDTLTPAVVSVQAVICAIGSYRPWGRNQPRHVDYEGVRNLAAASQRAAVECMVLVSSTGVTHRSPRNLLGGYLKYKAHGETALRDLAGLNHAMAYTIVRAGRLTHDPGRQTALRFLQGDRESGRISRADVAEVCVQALAHPAARNVTFEVIAGEGAPPITEEDWAALFAHLTPDL